MKLLNRATLVNQIRQYLLGEHFEELIPTLLSLSVPQEPTIAAFKVDSDYLATSPERYLKIAMGRGVGNCFAISPAFRDLEGSGRWHQPEFLMAEWYMSDATWMDMMDFTQKIITSLWPSLPHDPWPQVSWSRLWKSYVGVDWKDLITHDAMVLFAQSRGYTTDGATWEQLFHQIALNEIEPHFSQNPFFLTHFPSQISPLCKPIDNQMEVAERFELLIQGVELANGNSENLNSSSLSTLGDDPFIQAVSRLHDRFPHGLAGVGLGVDRLAALMSNTTVGIIQGKE